jgi:FKBP12-rapamycin complex-associated protein
LHNWDKALAAYEQKQEHSPDDINLTLGRMRCLEALAEWYVKNWDCLPLNGTLS